MATKKRKAAPKKAAPKKAAAKKAKAPAKAAPKKAAAKRAAPKKAAAKKAKAPAKAARRSGLRKIPEGAKFSGKNRLKTGFGNVKQVGGGSITAGGRGATYDKKGEKVTAPKKRTSMLRKAVRDSKVAFFDAKSGKRVPYKNAINARTGDFRAGLRMMANAGSGTDG